MSNRISEAFAKGKAFIPFITCGDPSLEITEQLVYAMEEAGADLIELGIPFSDPPSCSPGLPMLYYPRKLKVAPENRPVQLQIGGKPTPRPV